MRGRAYRTTRAECATALLTTWTGRKDSWESPRPFEAVAGSSPVGAHAQRRASQRRDQVAGLFKSIWRLMTGEVINSADVTIHNGQTKVILALTRAKDGNLFVSLKEASARKTQWATFEPNEFNQFVEAVGFIQNAMANEAKRISN
jgi:hypothetical protein